MGDIGKAISILVNSFSKYACKEGDANTLTKGELKDLLQNELAELLGKANDKAAMDSLFKELDTNQDNSVDFREFGRLIFCIADICYDVQSGKK